MKSCESLKVAGLETPTINSAGVIPVPGPETAGIRSGFLDGKAQVNKVMAVLRNRKKSVKGSGSR